MGKATRGSWHHIIHSVLSWAVCYTVVCFTITTITMIRDIYIYILFCMSAMMTKKWAMYLKSLVNGNVHILVNNLFLPIPFL